MWQTRTATLRGARTVPLLGTIILTGYDLRGATFRLEVRDRRDGGQLRAGLDTVTSAASQGVRVASYAVVDGTDQTILGLRINETTMEAMPANAADPGDDLVLTWGLHITPSGGTKFLAFEGPFIVEASTPA